MARATGKARASAASGPPPPAFRVVGIGASAGGLAALEELFRALPSEPGQAFVVIMHLDAKHESSLAELLQRCTRMPVRAVADRTAVEPNHVYVGPPGHVVTIERRVLRLSPLSGQRAPNLTIDAFFRSLARDAGRDAICVILSGTGTDGTLGLRAVKGEDGMVMAQDETASCTGMPRSAAATGLVDFVVPPREMPACLARYLERPASPGDAAVGPAEVDLLELLHEVFALLRAETGHDFSKYKTNTILRRVHRRVVVHQLEGLREYVRYLEDNRAEAALLFRELLVGVTSFFRDPEAFDALKQALRERVVPGRDATDPGLGARLQHRRGGLLDRHAPA